MTFHENVLIEINSGRLVEPFSVADVKALGPLPDKRYQVGGNVYPESTVNTYFPNNSQTADGVIRGKAVQNGTQAKYLRVGSTGGTRYLVIRASFLDVDIVNERLAELGELEDCEETQESLVRPDGARTDSGSGGDGGLTATSISDHFVDYLANKPFRLYSYEHARTWYPVHGPAVGWQQRLDAYRWNNANWASTLASLSPLVAQAGSIVKVMQGGSSPLPGEASGLFGSVALWGGTRHAPVPDAMVESALADIDRYLRSVVATPPTAPMNSTWTKVYALAFPDDFVIYDTRVAAAIISVAEDLYRRNHNHANNIRGVEANIDDFRKVFGALGTMTGASRGGTRPKGVRYRHWPAAYGSWEAQVDANMLCKGIRDSLNRRSIDGRNNWTLREVEAVLFMEGY